MRQHMLNGWLVAALVALVCLLGITAYAEVRKDIPQAVCVHSSRGVKLPGGEVRNLQPGVLRKHRTEGLNGFAGP